MIIISRLGQLISPSQKIYVSTWVQNISNFDPTLRLVLKSETTWEKITYSE